VEYHAILVNCMGFRCSLAEMLEVRGSIDVACVLFNYAGCIWFRNRRVDLPFAIYTDGT